MCIYVCICMSVLVGVYINKDIPSPQENAVST